MISKNKRFKAVLVLGPTGSGKTPLGQLWEKKSLSKQRYYHFDFGANLRSIAKTKKTGKLFTTEEIAFIRQVLDQGALLGNEHFYLARKILNRFIGLNHITSAGIIILNGLPRHIGQARETDAILNIDVIVHLACPPAVAWARIRNNTGGDRAGRMDDGLADVRNKIRLFNQKTARLIKYYRARKTKIIRLAVKENTTAGDMLESIRKSLG